MAEDDGEEIEFEPADEVAVQIEGIGNGHIEEGGFLHARPRIGMAFLLVPPASALLITVSSV
jgi:hypothetical protein